MVRQHSVVKDLRSHGVVRTWRVTRGFLRGSDTRTEGRKDVGRPQQIRFNVPVAYYHERSSQGSQGP